MKGKNPVITLLGSNSGNNLGDAAILSAILDSVSQEIPDAEFLVPSTNPSFTDRNYGKRYKVRGINVMPWTLSIRLLGLPTFRAIARSDCALICDGIIFGKQLLNPLFNFLITLVFVVPWAKLVGCKVICYSCGIGPFPSKLSRLCAKWVLNGCDLVIMRENDSKKLAEEIGCIKPIHVTGDAAFINPVNPPTRAREILSEFGVTPHGDLLGINVTKYIDSWLGKNERVSSPSTFIEMVADGVTKAASELGVNLTPIIFSTHPMDEPTATELAEKLNSRGLRSVVIGNRKLLSHDIQAVMRECKLFLGMRFHSLVLASAVGTPIIGMVYAPKVRGYMRLLNCERFTLELAALNSTGLSEAIRDGWQTQAELRVSQQLVVADLQRGARAAATLLKSRYFAPKSPTNLTPIAVPVETEIPVTAEDRVAV